MARVARRKQGPTQSATTRRRERTVRLSDDVAARVADGHPWVFGEALRGRQLTAAVGEVFDLVDSAGQFVARAVHDPGGPIVLRVFERSERAEYGAAHVRSAVRRAAAWRREVLQPGPDDCLRVLNGDSEGVPALNVDRYGAYLLLTTYSALGAQMVEGVVRALVDTWRPVGIYLRGRHAPALPNRPREPAQLIWGEVAPPEVVVTEGRVRFAVDVTAPVGTGLFIDMRNGRSEVASLAAGRRVLNCFSYTGAFSVVAAVHGAAEVVSVDVAARAHGRARRNCSLNGLADPARTLEFITGDTLAVLTRLASRGRRFELVVLDPPTFSSGKGKSFAALKDYADLVAAAAEVTAPGGVVCAACNTAKLSWDEFERSLGRGAHQAGRRALVLKRLAQPADFPTLPGFAEGRYLKLATMMLMQ